LSTRVRHRAPSEGGGSDARVVDEPVDDHLGDVGLHWD
jgi:hypothetical protein